jgi:predicted DCC family thiol-disulfide oxidoreductase YuxK
MARGKLTIRSFQDHGVLESFPGLTQADCMRELKLVDEDGRVFGGAEAVVRTLLISRPLLGRLARLYYVPGLRWVCDRLYAFIARYRYRLFGRSQACEDDACSVHFH